MFSINLSIHMRNHSMYVVLFDDGTDISSRLNGLIKVQRVIDVRRLVPTTRVVARRLELESRFPTPRRAVDENVNTNALYVSAEMYRCESCMQYTLQYIKLNVFLENVFHLDAKENCIVSN